jgi:hypothetical protein
MGRLQGSPFIKEPLHHAPAANEPRRRLAQVEQIMLLQQRPGARVMTLSGKRETEEQYRRFVGLECAPEALEQRQRPSRCIRRQ